MASIQKMKNGRWRYRVSYKENGKYKTKTKGGFRTKKEAELAAAELEKQLHKGYDINAGDQLFPEYMRNWFELYKKGKHSPEHDKNVEYSVQLVEEYFAGVKMKELTRDMYQKFINDCR
ncbi:Arm DNA-binding domain-containing protein [Geobacillus stearothermophilus]|nr:Arm DNA-binding domain-containing protein [Geobacillus stearothermophilus]MED3740281.1 Arm DNA-binding domain-containing protein [Geobacillus stearothermophilus]MED3767826.1 Arm DNA-binding domain-containing protein [Geobacillus stearothermophilus]MED3776008.1 Arm DNA-binding domain-containing protein [Geobacillus stearothermophilus]